MTIDKKQFKIDLFRAYYDARKNKRNTINALRFEHNYESNLLALAEELISNEYEVGKSVAFVVKKPVKREIFAADFRDRVVHHFIYNQINPIFEKMFINDNYSCRVGKGNLYGVKRANHFIKACSRNYKKDCYVLKLDISGYFMSIDKNILYEKVRMAILENTQKINLDFELLLKIVRKIIFNNPTKNCMLKGKKSDWEDLPKNKSLFFSEKDKGLSIGNLTSQLFGNVYLNDFDHFVKEKLHCRYYGRYVDDIFIVHPSKVYLKKVIVEIRKYLAEKLALILHPNKIYLQNFFKGVDFLGAYIKPHRIYIRDKVKGNFVEKFRFWKAEFLGKEMTKNDKKKFTSSINSYLGAMKHLNTFNLRKKIAFENIPVSFDFDWEKDFLKVEVR